MYLDRSWADCEIKGYDLVWYAGVEPLKDVTLAIRQRSEPGLHHRAFGVTGGVLLEAIERRVHRPEQKLILKWLFKEVDSAIFHCLHGQGYIAVTGNDNDWNSSPNLAQAPQEIDPADSRHPHVGDDAPGFMVGSTSRNADAES